MLLERAELLVQAGTEGDFRAAMDAEGCPLLRDVPGVRTVTLGQGVENSDKFLLLVEWESMAAHTTFNGTPASKRLRDIITPFSRGGVMEHFRMG